MGKALTTGEFLEKMLVVEPATIANFFQTENLTFPKKIKMDIMKNALRAYVVKTRKECLTLDSRKNYRLLWFNIFTEFQLEMLLDEVASNDEIQMDFIKKLYLKILIQLKIDAMPLLKKFVEYLDSQDTIIEGTVIVANDVNTAFRGIFVEAENEFEGVPLENFRAIIHNSATQEGMNYLGNKYGIVIPKKFSGDYVKDYVMHKLKNKGLLTDELKERLENAKSTEARKIAVENGIKNVITLNKKEIIEYILERVLSDYKEPENDSVYEMTIPINPDEEKYSTLLLQYEQMGGDIKVLREALNDLSGNDKSDAEEKLRQKEAELEETRAQLDDITKKFSVLELRSGTELDNKIYGDFNQAAANGGYSESDLNSQSSVPNVNMAPQNNQNALVLKDDNFEDFMNDSNLPAFFNNDADDEAGFLDKIKSMASFSGYSILIILIHILIMLGIGVGVFLILYAAI